jgi:hypothetical protein
MENAFVRKANMASLSFDPPTGGAALLWLLVGGCVLAAAAIVAFVLARPGRGRGIAVAAAGGLALLAGFGVVGWLLRDHLTERRLAEAMDLFRADCRAAGETRLRDPQGGAVDGVLWMNWREDLVFDAFAVRARLDDPWGHECGLEDCIARLLRVSYGAASDPDEARRHAVGFAWVETVDPRAPQRYRYTAGIDVVHWRSGDEIEAARRSSGEEPGPAVYGFALQREEIEAFSARYGLRWRDMSTPEDRAHWIAGGALEVVDLQSGEVIARRIGYMIDTLQGRHPDGIAPWLYAMRTACPAFASAEIVDRPRQRHGTAARDFALEVLH